ncbi:MAG: substrate-binding domain-containing protein [Prevotellaceae bacterium]|jgi:phosphate transport system substrate-binding protein|nr:substrate-binding domain-containing protein [Prevotellaceae bacterium]
MKNSVLLLMVSGFLSLTLAGCGKNEDSVQDFKIEGLTFDNFPRMDGSTSTQPLKMLIACKLLGVRYDWTLAPTISGLVGERWLAPHREDIPATHADFFDGHVKVSQTHGAFINLIDGGADLIMTHRTLSPDEKAYADEKGITLTETPIALDAFVFVVNKNNPVKSLTVGQVRDIYRGTITNWQQVGGNDEAVRAFVRPRNSGSQEVMESLVMQGAEIDESFETSAIASMAGVFPEITHFTNSLCYTFDYYKEIMMQVPHENVPKIAVNNIFPNAETVADRTYPFVAEVHVAIRSDLDKNSMAYKLYKLLQTENGKNIIAESGYIPN